MSPHEPSAPEDGATPVLGAALSRRPDPAAALRRGDSVGRYVILDWVGQGGMGVVYAGYDPELDRKVAIKLVRPDLRDADSRAELLREARAMARVHHPAVIAIHDIGVVDEQVFLAMEFIDGGTLAAWLRAAPRTWPEVLAMFVQAGRGLAQAHQVGVLHRDFKPDNVLVARDGRAVVTDFGLARPTASGPAELEVTHSGARSTWRSPGEADDAHELPGTPPYMAPEQLAGRPATERSEQFSFCVALFEGLHGVRPFAGASPETLAAAIVAGPAAPTRPVPAWLERAVLRGLSPEPAQRWPSMMALLAALERGGPRRWPWALAGVLALAGTAAAVWMPQAPFERCSGGDLELGKVWDEPRRQAIRGALAASGLGDRSATIAVIEREVDRHAHDWAEARREACLATHARGEQSPQQLERRMACFTEQLGELDDLLAAFEQPEGDMLERAASAVRRLPPPQRCTLGELESFAAEPGPLMDRLVALRTIDRLGQSARALPLAQALVDDAADRPALAIEARLLLGRAQLATGEQAAAQRTFAETYWSAIAAGLDELAAQAALQRSGAMAEGADGEATRTWVRHAEAVVTRLGRDPHQLGKLAGILAQVEDAGGDFAAAREHYERALELFNRAGAAAHGDAGTTHANYANALREVDAGAARTHHERALELFEASLGSDHPNTHSVRLNLASLLASVGEEDQARALIEQARRGLEQALGPRHPALVTVWGTLGTFDYTHERYTEARSAFERAHALALELHGPQHPQTIAWLNNLGNTVQALGDLDTARRHFEAALAATTALRGPTHPDLVNPLTSVASVAINQRRFDAAREHLERALTIQDAALGRRTIAAAYIVGRQAELAEATGQLESARKRYLEAAEIADEIGAAGRPIAGQLLHSLALLERRLRRTADAREHAEAALAVLAPLHGEQNDRVVELRQLLADTASAK